MSGFLIETPLGSIYALNCDKEMFYNDFILESVVDGLVQFSMPPERNYTRWDGIAESLFAFNWLNKFTSVNIQ